MWRRAPHLPQASSILCVDASCVITCGGGSPALQRWLGDAHPVALHGGSGAVTCLHSLKESDGSAKRVMFGTQEGVVATVEVYPTATTTSSAATPMLELSAPVSCLAHSPDGSRIAAATESGVISVASRDDPLDVLCLTGHTGAVLCLSYDPKGEYLASVGADGTARLWKLVDGDSIELHVVPDATFLDWHPAGTQLAVATKTDIRILNRNVWTSSTPLTPNYEARMLQYSFDGRYLAAVGNGGERAVLVWRMDTRTAINGLSHQSAITALSWSPDNVHVALLSEGKFCLWDCASAAALAKAVVPPLSAPPKEQSTTRSKNAIIPEAQGKVDGIEWNEDSYTTTQPAFQPNSGDASQPWHWLNWTHEGLAYVLEWQEPEIVVEFYNRGEYGGFKFPNSLNFTMAAVASGTAVFGSKRDPAQAVSLSTLFYRPCDKLMHDPDNPLAHWVANMPNGEDITAVAVGTNWAAAATSKQFLRIFTEKAVQKAVIALPGPVVAMSGFKKHLAVVYHRTPAVLDRQNLELRLLNLDTESCEAMTSLGLSANTTLSWLGFSWRGMVLVKDSNGVLKGLTLQFGSQWTTIFDFKSVAKDHGTSDWWVTSVDYEEVRGVPIRSSDGQPATFGIMKHPVPIAFTPQLDAIQAKPARSSDEVYTDEVYLRHQVFAEHRKWSNQQGFNISFDGKNDVVDDLLLADAHLLKVMRIALKNGETLRAWDYASLLYFPKSLTIAVKLAQMQSYNALADKLWDLLEKRKETFEEERQRLNATGDTHSKPPPPPPIRDARVSVRRQEDDEEEEMEMETCAVLPPATKKRTIRTATDATAEADDALINSSSSSSKEKRTTVKAPRKKAKASSSSSSSAAAAGQRREDAASNGSASSFSFTSVRSESGAVSVRLAGRPAATAPPSSSAVTAIGVGGKENGSSLKTNSGKKKPTTSMAETNGKTKKTKSTAANGSSTGAAGKSASKKRELTQPSLSFFTTNKQQQQQQP